MLQPSEAEKKVEADAGPSYIYFYASGNLFMGELFQDRIMDTYIIVRQPLWVTERRVPVKLDPPLQSTINDDDEDEDDFDDDDFYDEGVEYKMEVEFDHVAPLYHGDLIQYYRHHIVCIMVPNKKLIDKYVEACKTKFKLDEPEKPKEASKIELPKTKRWET